MQYIEEEDEEMLAEELGGSGGSGWWNWLGKSSTTSGKTHIKILKTVNSWGASESDGSSLGWAMHVANMIER